MSFASLRLRLLLGAAGFILIALALAAVGLTFLFRAHVEAWVDGELNAYLDQVITGIDAGPDGKLVMANAPADPRFDQPMSGRYWEVVVEPDGPVLRSRSLWDYELPLPTEKDVGNEVHRHRVVGPGDSRLYLVQRRIALPERLGGKTARAAVAVDVAAVDAAVRRFATVLAPLLLLLSTLLILATWVQVDVGLKPLAAMRQKLADVSAGARKRLGHGFPDEVQPLASEVDMLLDERDRQIEQARARAADLAHGLKTPLQVLLSDAELLKSKGETSIAEEIEGIATALQRHTERHLSRARMAAHNANASADVGEIAERVVRVMKRTPEGRRLAWTLELPTGIGARIDAEDLAEAIGNLSENAVRHANSHITVSVRREAGDAVVSLIDDGPGIPVDRQSEVLDRGTRLDSSGPGAGLGLAIVKDIADEWGAKLSFQAGESVFGVTLQLPIAERQT